MSLVRLTCYSLIFFILGIGTIYSNDTNVDTIQLFKSLTNQKAVFSSQYGNKEELPDNAKFCIDEIVKNSNSKDYYGLNIKAKDNSYDTYSEDTRYSEDLKESVGYAERILLSLKKIGFLRTLKNKKLKPAIMFDIDNTLAFTSEYDDDETGNSPEIKETSDFVRKYCFKNGIECYFITARSCSSKKYNATYKWLKDTFKFNETILKDNLYLTGNIKGCENSKYERVAYKDLLKYALSKKQHLFWIMSIGDQLTDVFGENSGIKVLLPNKLFKSNVVPHADKKEDCNFTTVVKPSDQCLKKLESVIINRTGQDNCKNCKNPDGC